jgi:hypothetical protein
MPQTIFNRTTRETSSSQNLETPQRFLNHFPPENGPRDSNFLHATPFNIPLNWAGAKAEADAKRVARTAALVNIVVSFITSRDVIR